MKIPKAIEILDDLLGEGPQFSSDDRREAIKLGIEALKQLKKLCLESCSLVNLISWPLPGEDKE